MVMKLYGHPMITCTARVRACLHEMGVEYGLVPLDFISGEQKQQPYLSLNPFGQAPALVDGELTLFESRAITRYLAHKYKDNGTNLLRLNNLTEHAIVNTWMEVEAHHYNGPISSIIRQIIFNSFCGRALDETVIMISIKELEKVLDIYEERLTRSKYLAGDYFTMADLHHIPYTFLFMKTPHSTLVTSRAHVNAWWNDISSRPAMLKVLEESRAITGYIAHSRFGQGPPLVVCDEEKMAIVGVWMEVKSHHFDPVASKLSWELFYKPIFGMNADAAVVEEHEAKLATVLDIYKVRLAESKYLGRDEFSLADLHHLPNIYYLMKGSVKKLFYSRPHVSAWAANILARLAWSKVVAMQSA